MYSRVSVYVVCFAFATCSLAQIAYEGFDSGLADWESSGDWTIAIEGEALRGSFPALGMPFPASGRWQAVPASSSGTFTGNFADQGVGILRFAFRMADAMPSSFTVRWQAGTNTYFRSLTAKLSAHASPGEWVRFMVSLDPRHADQWVGQSAAFANALTQVDWLAFDITRSGTALQRFDLDHVTLDYSPLLLDMEIVNGDEVDIELDALPLNWPVTVEVSKDDFASWQPVITLQADQRAGWLFSGYTFTNSKAAMRLRLPVWAAGRE